MFNFNSEHTLAGPGYITLNVIRVLNIISLLTVVVASWIMLVMTVKTSNFFFFDGVSHFITSTIGIFLIVSECTLFPKYFARNWPMLSPSSGFVFLGLAMIILGFNILGNLNKTATSIENLGLPLWREVIASGILSSIMGLFNIIATFVFCDSAQGITGRRVRSHGAIAPKDEELASTGKTFSLTSSQSTRSQRSQRSQRPLTPVLPSYHPNETTSTSDRHKSRFGLKFPIRMSGMHISKPIIDTNTTANNSPPRWQSRNSPVVENLQRPPTALHPAFDPVRAPSSRYSEVSHLQRFSRGDLI